ncbi:MAG: 30S ribosomal protein S4e [Candidatus Altiarchaeota archaeon]|nr:30S ribosomal protein S4e [Candidatus Altiarchaeota archaeon]
MTHQKRLAAPGSLKIHRKEAKWMPSSRPGPHPKEGSIPLLVLMRDHLKLADNRKEARYVIQNKGVLVDGRRVKDDKYPVGLFDTVSIPDAKLNFVILIDSRGRFYPEGIDAKEAGKKLCKIIGKTVLKGGSVQLNLYDGKNILVEAKDSKKYRVKDTLVLKLPDLSIDGHIPFGKDKICIITKGLHVSKMGKLLEVTQSSLNIDSLSTVEAKGGKITTLTDYTFVVGEKEPILSVLSK